MFDRVKCFERELSNAVNEIDFAGLRWPSRGCAERRISEFQTFDRIRRSVHERRISRMAAPESPCSGLNPLTIYLATVP